MAAFRSRSITIPQLSHEYIRSDCDIVSLMLPHWEHIFVDGKNRFATTSRLPYHAVLYSSWRANSPHPASAIDLARWRFAIMPRTPRSSITMTDLVLASSVVA